MVLKQDAMLDAVPHMNRAAVIEEQADGLLVTVPRQRPWWARGPVRWFFSLSDERIIQMDAVGGFVLSLVNGHRSMEKVIERLMDRYHLTFQEARASVFQFMKTLMERGVVGMDMGRGKNP